MQASCCGLLKAALILLMFTLDRGYSTSSSDSFRVEYLTQERYKMNFTWILRSVSERPFSSFHDVQQRCKEQQLTTVINRKEVQLSGRLPRVGELKYFYKTLPFQSEEEEALNVQTDPESTEKVQYVLNGSYPQDVFFYLDDILEATKDFPTEAEGEKLCLLVRKSPSSALRLALTESGRSCSTPVNLLVCAYELRTDHSKKSSKCANVDWEWIDSLEATVEANKKNTCVESTWFFSALGVILFIVASLLLLFILFFVKYLRAKKYTFSGESNLWSSMRSGSTRLNGLLHYDSARNRGGAANTLSGAPPQSSHTYDYISSAKLDIAPGPEVRLMQKPVVSAAATPASTLPATEENLNTCVTDYL